MEKGSKPALDTIWPEAYRRYCTRHLCNNFKKEYPGLLMYKLFWSVADASSEFIFNKSMEKMVSYGEMGCRKWCLDLGDMKLWAKHAFDTSLSSDENTSNFVENFNSTLGVHNCNPVLSLLEGVQLVNTADSNPYLQLSNAVGFVTGVRRIAMVKHATRQHAVDSWPEEGICPNIVTRLRNFKKESRACISFYSSRGRFEVKDGQTYLRVDLNEWTCACGLRQISGIPCKHAIKAILDALKEPKDYVSEWYSVKVYKEAYNLTINPVPNLGQWPDYDVPTLVPPPLRIAIGMPSSNRRREPREKRKGKWSVSIRYQKCKCFRHNYKTYKGGYTAKERQEMNTQELEIQSHTQSQIEVNVSMEASTSEGKWKKRKTQGTL